MTGVFETFPTPKTKLKEKLNMKNNATNSPVLTLVYGAAIVSADLCGADDGVPANQLFWTDPVSDL